MNYEESFSLTLGETIQNSNSIIWQYDIPIQKRDEKKFFIHFEKNTFVILNYEGTDFPRSIKLALKGFNGDHLANLKQTQICYSFSLIQTCPYELNGNEVRDLIYEGNQRKIDIGSNRNIQFICLADENPTPIETPFENKIPLNFKIIHV